MALHESRLRAIPATQAGGVSAWLQSLDRPGLLTRGLYLFSAALTGAVLYLGVQWPAGARPAPAAVAPAAKPAPAAPAATVAAQRATTPDSLAAGALITESLRGVNAARQDILLAQPTARQATALPGAVSITSAAPAPVSPPVSHLPTAPAPAAVPVAPSPSPSMVAEGPQSAPADVGAGPAQRSPVQVPNHISIPATVPPAAATPTRPH